MEGNVINFMVFIMKPMINNINIYNKLETKFKDFNMMNEVKEYANMITDNNFRDNIIHTENIEIIRAIFYFYRLSFEEGYLKNLCDTILETATEANKEIVYLEMCNKVKTIYDIGMLLTEINIKNLKIVILDDKKKIDLY